MKTTADSTARDLLDEAVKGWPSPLVRRHAHRLIADLCELAEVESVVIFGSAVRPGVTSQDLDVLVIYDDRKPDVTSPSMEIDLRLYSRKQAESLLTAGHDLVGWAIRYGAAVFDPRCYWSNLREAWRGRVPMPSIEEAAIRQQRAWVLFNDLLELGDLDAALEQYVSFLTHEGRICLLKSGVYPASRPELPGQLMALGEFSLATNLNRALRVRGLRAEGIDARTEQFLLASQHIGRRFAGT